MDALDDDTAAAAAADDDDDDDDDYDYDDDDVDDEPAEGRPRGAPLGVSTAFVKLCRSAQTNCFETVRKRV